MCITNNFVLQCVSGIWTISELGYGGLVSGLRQFLLHPQLPQNMLLASKVVKSDLKIFILLYQSKSPTHSVWGKMSTMVGVGNRVKLFQSSLVVVFTRAKFDTKKRWSFFNFQSFSFSLSLTSLTATHSWIALIRQLLNWLLIKISKIAISGRICCDFIWRQTKHFARNL